MKLLLILVIVISCNPTADFESNSKVQINQNSDESIPVPPVLFEPDNLSNLVLWLDAKDSSSIFTNSNCTGSVSNGSSVGCWLDKSGNSNNASISIGSSMSTFNDVLNSASINFDGVDDYYDNNNSYTAKVLYFVFRVDSTLQATTDLGQLWGFYQGVGQVSIEPRTSRRDYSFDGNTSKKAIHGLDGNSYELTSAEDATTQKWTYNQFQILKVKFDVDVVITRQILGSLFPAFPLGTHQFGGQISEMIIYSSDQTLIEEQKIEGYLACKWSLQASLPGAHPYKSTCPIE